MVVIFSSVFDICHFCAPAILLISLKPIVVAKVSLRPVTARRMDGYTDLCSVLLHIVQCSGWKPTPFDVLF